MGTKVIRLDALDLSSVERAIREVKQYKEDLIKAVNELVRTLTEEGIRIAAVNVQALGALDTGELTDSFMGVYDDASHTGILRTDAYYAVFVEYGTGVVGAGSKHPGPWVPPVVPYGSRVYTGHDTYKHGENGWWYISERDGRRHWTRGQPSRPFFYNTFLQLQQMAQQRFNDMNIGGGST